MATSPFLETRHLTRQPAHLEAPTLLRLWHLTSLDAPTVAFVWTLAFAAAAGVHLDLRIPTALALAAWSIYIGDRILDAHRALDASQKLNALRDRHYFHWRHRRRLLPIAIAAAVAALVCVAFARHSIPFAARQRNTLLAAATAAYFTSVHGRRRMPLRRFTLPVKFPIKLPKELFVGILFTLACAAPAWTRSALAHSGHAQLNLLPPILCFIVLAWLNCHAIESWESNPSQGCRSLIIPSALAFTAITISAAIVSLAQGQLPLAALLATASLSAVLIALLDRFKSHLSPVALRALADLVLLTPAALLAIPGLSR